jgi:hypothetical protein
MRLFSLASLIATGFVVFGVIGGFFLIRPSFGIRILKNPWMPDTPWNRLQMRALGLVFFLFASVALSMILAKATRSPLVEGFYENLLIALWLVFSALWVLGVSSWIAWRFTSVRVFVRRNFPPEKIEAPAWERGMTAIFCSILAAVLATALLLATRSHNPV